VSQHYHGSNILDTAHFLDKEMHISEVQPPQQKGRVPTLLMGWGEKQVV
jgi:hypothetical protein